MRTYVEIDFDSVTKRYGDVCALDALTFSSAGGEVIGLLGSNGAGKTTTVRLLLGLLQPDEGRVTVAGVGGDGAVARPIGYAPQETGLQMSLTVRDNIRFWAGVFGLGEPEADSRAAPYVERLDLGHRLDQRVANLSVGEQRKAQLLTAVLHEPQLLVLDEPTAFLDVPSRREVVRMVRELADRGCSVLYSTHVLVEAEELCQSLVVLHRGRRLYHGPLRPFVAENAVLQLVVAFGDQPDDGLIAGLRATFADVVVSNTAEVVIVATADEDHGSLIGRLTTSLGDAMGLVTSLRVVQPGLESAVLTAIEGAREAGSNEAEVRP